MFKHYLKSKLFIMKIKTVKNGLSCLFLGIILLGSCKKYSDQPDKDFGKDPKNSGASYYYNTNFDFYVLADGITLDRFNTRYPGSVNKSVQISGLQLGEKLLAIDFRPASGQLYGVGSTSRIYVINQNTGVARMIGTGPFTPVLNGTLVGFDFNPTVDRIRIVTNNRQNLRLNPETGAVVAVDGSINIGGQPTPMLAAAAYENSIAGAATTTLYSIDPTTKKLYRNNPPNAGTLEEVGSLNLNISGEGGYDIDGKTNTGLAIFKVNGRPTLFSVNDYNAATQVLATYSKNYSAIAIPTPEVAYAPSTNNTLLIFNPNNSDAPVSKPFTGQAAGERIIGLDMRPLNGQLYALGSGSRIYTVNASSGLLTLVGTLTTPLAGTDFGFDFNPVVDRIRIVSNTGQNLRANPTNAVTITDMPINPSGRAVTAIAYRNNFAGATATVLYDIDVATDKLYRQDPPNNGTLVEIGSLGINIGEMSGFDIGGMSNNGYALLRSGGVTKLYRVNIDYANSVYGGGYNSYYSSNTILSYKRDFNIAVNGFALGLGF